MSYEMMARFKSPFSEQVVGVPDVVNEGLVPHDDLERNNIENVGRRRSQPESVKIELKLKQC